MNPTMRRPLASSATATVGVLLAAVAVVVASTDALLDLYAAALAMSAGILAVVLGSARVPWRDPWWTLTAAVGGFAVHLNVLLLAGGRAPTPVTVAANVVQFAAYVLVVTASERFVRGRSGGGDRDGLIDGTIVGCAAAVVIWQWTALHDADRSPVEVGLAAVPLLLLAVVLSLAVRLLFVSADVPAARLLASSTGLSFVGNLVNLSPGPGNPVSPLSLGCWIGAQVLVVAAALHPSRPALSRPMTGEPASFVGRLVLLGLALAAIPISTVMRSSPERAVPVIGTVLVTTLVLWRLGRLLVDRDRRTRQQELMLELGRMAVDADAETLHRAAADLLARALGSPAVAVLDTRDGGLVVRSSAGAWPAGLTDPERALLHRAAAEASRDGEAVRVELRTSELWLVPYGPASEPHGVLAVAAGPNRSRPDLRVVDGTAQLLGSGVRRLDAEAELVRTTLHDALTGLPNRVLLYERLVRRVEQARRSPAPFAVLFVDLDGFKAVNDGLGHGVGDQVLVVSADRLRCGVRPADTVARVSGDEFVVVVTESDAAVAEDVARRLGAALAAPVQVGAARVAVSASIGAVVVTPPLVEGTDVDRILRAADELMYEAKRAGRNGVRTAVLEPAGHRAPEARTV